MNITEQLQQEIHDMKRVNKHVATLRFAEAKNQKIAMEKALQMRDAQDHRAQTI